MLLKNRRIKELSEELIKELKETKNIDYDEAIFILELLRIILKTAEKVER